MAISKVRIGAVLYSLEKDQVRFKIARPSRQLQLQLQSDQRVRGLVYELPSLLRVIVNRADQLDCLMKEVRSSFVAHHAYRFLNDPLNHGFVPTGILLIKSQNPSLVQQVAAKNKLSPLPAYAAAPLLHRFAVTNASPANPLKLANAISEVPGIDFCEPDYLTNRKTSQLPAYWGKQWHLKSELPGLGIESAWGVTRGEADTHICILDDGFDLTNPDLQGYANAADFAPLEDALDPAAAIVPADALPYPNAEIGDFHGTPCAGLAIGRGAVNVAGVAPGCSWMPARISLGNGSMDMTLRVLEYISDRADIVSCSWGVRPSPHDAPSNAMLEVVQGLSATGGRRKHGLVMCFAAGNENLPLREAAEQNRGYEYVDDSTGRHLGTFFEGEEIHSAWCEIPGVIVVGAVAPNGEKASYSNWGKQLSVCAASGDWIPSQLPAERLKMLPRLWTTDNDKHGRGLVEVGLSDTEYGAVTDSMTGTSGAAPLVAGACGLLLSKHPGMTAAQVKQTIEESATKSGLRTGTTVKTIFNNRGQDGTFGADGHSLWYGFGLVNPAAALKAAE